MTQRLCDSFCHVINVYFCSWIFCCTSVHIRFTFTQYYQKWIGLPRGPVLGHWTCLDLVLSLSCILLFMKASAKWKNVNALRYFKRLTTHRSSRGRVPCDLFIFFRDKDQLFYLKTNKQQCNNRWETGKKTVFFFFFYQHRQKIGIVWQT